DMEAMALTPDIDPETRIVTIASGGCNALSYVTAAPVRVTALDLNPTHVALVRLKLAGAANLPDYDRFFRFFGEADKRENLAEYRRFLRPMFDAATRAYWDRRPAG